MIYSHQIESCFDDAVGAHGLSRDAFLALVAETAPAVQRLRDWYAESSLPLLRLPESRDDLRDLEKVAADCRRRFDDVVILGTGGSSLGGLSLYALAGDTSPRLHFLENVDPHSFAALTARLAAGRTGIIVISKSGGTAETLTQLLCCMAWLKQTAGDSALADQIVAMAEPGGSPLRKLAARYGFRVLDHDPKVGGRFAVLSLVGMLPALIAGLDAAAVRDGAAAVLSEVLAGDDPASCPPVAGAALAVGLARERGAVMSVMFPYVDRLAPFALWYRQLWAESLGKDGLGTTPLRAMGTVDQHSQLQLYLDGPADKMFTVIMGPSAGTGPLIDPELVDDPALAPLLGRQMGDLLDACQRATAETLAARGRPVRVMALEAVDERTLGALMMHFMLETIIAAHLLGVDPFDQPAVEEGKVLARRYMQEMGGSGP